MQIFNFLLAAVARETRNISQRRRVLFLKAKEYIYKKNRLVWFGSFYIKKNKSESFAAATLRFFFIIITLSSVLNKFK